MKVYTELCTYNFWVKRVGCEEDGGEESNSVTGHSTADCLKDKQREAAHANVEDKVHNTEMCRDEFPSCYYDI